MRSISESDRAVRLTLFVGYENLRPFADNGLAALLTDRMMHVLFSILYVYILGRLARVLWYRAKRLAYLTMAWGVLVGLLVTGC